MPALRDHRPPEVLSTDEARRALPKTSQGFRKNGASAEPVFFGAHRQPAGVMLSYERYLRMRGAQQHVRLERQHDAIGLVAQD